MARLRQLAFLKQIDAHKKRHSGRTLLDHLQRTEQILSSWECAEATCAAGMFHSVYGTNAFRHACLTIDCRSDLIAVIGEAAERLVYVFSASLRPGELLSGFRTGFVSDRFTASFIEITESECMELVKIECANLIEQRKGLKFIENVIKRIPSLRLSTTMYTGLIEFCESSRSN